MLGVESTNARMFSVSMVDRDFRCEVGNGNPLLFNDAPAVVDTVPGLLKGRLCGTLARNMASDPEVSSLEVRNESDTAEIGRAPNRHEGRNEREKTRRFEKEGSSNEEQKNAGNGLDVHAYRCVVVAARNRQNNCVHHPHCDRLPPGVETRTGSRRALFLLTQRSLRSIAFSAFSLSKPSA
jgi:hypothetical protein